MGEGMKTAGRNDQASEPTVFVIFEEAVI